MSTGDTLEEIVRAIAALPEPRGWIGAPRGMAGVSAVPEPASWALMILGFGGAGVVLRHRRRALAVA